MSKQKSKPLFCFIAATEKNMAIFPVRLLTREGYRGTGGAVFQTIFIILRAPCGVQEPPAAERGYGQKVHFDSAFKKHHFSAVECLFSEKIGVKTQKYKVYFKIGGTSFFCDFVAQNGLKLERTCAPCPF